MKALRGLLVVAVAAACLARPAGAVTSLQLYMKGGTYDSATESWLSTTDPLELWVIGATSPSYVHYISHLVLFIGVPEGYWDESATVTITGATGPGVDNSSLLTEASPYPPKGEVPPTDFDQPIVLDSTNDWFGHPNDTGLFGAKNFPSHGVYNVPIHFWAVPLPLLAVESAGETAYDYNKNFTDLNVDGIPDDPSELGQDTGDIHYLNIDYAPFAPTFMLHFDVVGLAHNGQDVWRFAPFSHDADAPPEGYIPEPATLSLLAISLLGLGLGRSRRK